MSRDTHGFGCNTNNDDSLTMILSQDSLNGNRLPLVLALAVLSRAVRFLSESVTFYSQRAQDPMSQKTIYISLIVERSRTRAKELQRPLDRSFKHQGEQKKKL